MAELLNKLYYDPKSGFVGAQALYQKARELDPKITLKNVKDWNTSQIDIQRFQDQKKRFDGFKIASHNPNSWQMDLAFWEKRPILTAININLRLGYAKLLSNKTVATVLAALKVVVRLHKVDILTTDIGNEFMNVQAQEFFKSQKIDHFNNEPGDHGTMGEIERFNRTIKQRLTKISPNRITQKLIADVIENYNSTFHRSIGMTPNEAKGKVMESELKHNQEEADRIDNELEIGSNVLYRLKKQTFDKDAARWRYHLLKAMTPPLSSIHILSGGVVAFNRWYLLSLLNYGKKKTAGVMCQYILLVSNFSDNPNNENDSSALSLTSSISELIFNFRAQSAAAKQNI